MRCLWTTLFYHSDVYAHKCVNCFKWIMQQQWSTCSCFRISEWKVDYLVYKWESRWHDIRYHFRRQSTATALSVVDCLTFDLFGPCRDILLTRGWDVDHLSYLYRSVTIPRNSKLSNVVPVHYISFKKNCGINTITARFWNENQMKYCATEYCSPWGAWRI